MGKVVASIIAIILVFYVLFNFIAVWLWGAIAVGVFGLPAVGFWQMLGLRILLGLLFPLQVSVNND